MAKRPPPALAVLTAHGFPTAPGPGLGFTPEDDARFARGWPALRVLTSERVSAKEAVARATEALDAIDPTLPRAVSRDVAQRYLVGYRFGPNLFLDGAIPDVARRRAERAAAMADPAPADLSLLRAIFDADHLHGMGDTYSAWRVPEVLFLFEAFLGTEPVARAVVAHLVREAVDLSRWGAARIKPNRTNATPHATALGAAWLLERSPGPVASELRQTLAAGPSPEGTPAEGQPRAYFALLRWLADPRAPLDPSLADLELRCALVTGALGPAQRHVAAAPFLLPDEARLLWLVGTAHLGGKLNVTGLLHDPLVESLLPVRDPGVVRLVALIATQRKGRAAAAAWLAAHADYARPILQALAALEDPREQKAAKAALELLSSAKTAPAVELTEAQVEAEVARVFAALGLKLRATRSKKSRIAAIQGAYEQYTEIRAAGGDATPEAYFTHRFGDFELGEFGLLAVEAVEADP